MLEVEARVHTTVELREAVAQVAEARAPQQIPLPLLVLQTLAAGVGVEDNKLLLLRVAQAVQAVPAS
jgi:hypothetical protein